MKKTLALIAPLALLGACSSAMEAVRGPELAPIGYPAALVPVNQQYLEPPAQAASANSLWRTGARSFFGDQRARHVGDILTVNIDIDDRAQVQNSTARSRNNEINSGYLERQHHRPHPDRRGSYLLRRSRRRQPGPGPAGCPGPGRALQPVLISPG